MGLKFTYLFTVLGMTDRKLDAYEVIMHNV